MFHSWVFIVINQVSPTQEEHRYGEVYEGGHMSGPLHEHHGPRTQCLDVEALRGII